MSRRFLFRSITVLSSDPRYIGRIRALAAQTRRNDAAVLKTRQDLLKLAASDARISAEVHALAEVFGEKTKIDAVPASAFVRSDLDNEVERQRKAEKNDND